VRRRRSGRCCRFILTPLWGTQAWGDVYLERGNYKKAKEMFEKAIELLAGKRDSFVNPAVYERSDRFVRLKRRIERCEEMMRKG
jgi:tetratricopeptide (TPR) repeat protein